MFEDDFENLNLNRKMKYKDVVRIKLKFDRKAH